ncbi:hypothetical protein E2C01_077692 [Portunus trituberculatus]|uniref:Uncharacterized protein n=1 Tax=Portunus trituberculatus TaxID=210409 RepID=A0A5B7IKV6_PORTR|nr:hypothetical protein [Portunus trituberculatus]
MGPLLQVSPKSQTRCWQSLGLTLRIQESPIT